MIETLGTIAAIDGDQVLVRVEQKGCGRCHEEGGCGGNNLGNMLHTGPETFTLRNPGDVKIGDCVTIIVAEGSILRTATHAYLVPLLSMLLGAFAGHSLAGEAGAIGGAISGLVLAWFGVRQFQSRHLEPHIKR